MLKYSDPPERRLFVFSAKCRLPSDLLVIAANNFKFLDPTEMILLS